MWWLALLIACSDDERLDALEARVVELETKHATLEAEHAERRAIESRRPVPADAVDLSHWPVRQVEPGRYTVDRERMNDLMSMEEWSKQARAIPHRGPDGDIDGYRLSGIRHSSVLAALGLKNGDVIHALNGISVTGFDRVAEAYEQAQRDDRLEASITRRGVTMTLVWEPGTVPAKSENPAE